MSRGQLNWITLGKLGLNKVLNFISEDRIVTSLIIAMLSIIVTGPLVVMDTWSFLSCTIFLKLAAEIKSR